MVEVGCVIPFIVTVTIAKSSNTLSLVELANSTKNFVSSPAMNSVCVLLLESKGPSIKLATGSTIGILEINTMCQDYL